MEATVKELRKQRERLIQRVRTAYNKMEQWDKKHTQAMDELGVFMLRFPQATKK